MRRSILALLVAIAAPAAGCYSPCGADFAPLVNRAILDESLALGTAYLLNNQKPDGHFVYEYDWKTETFSPGDNQVRQTGAMWGLALIYHDHPTLELAAAVERSIEFFKANSRTTPEGQRFIVYPDTKDGSTGNHALAALTLIDYLRANPPQLTEQQRADMEQLLDQYLAQLVRSRRPDGTWHGSYRLDDGTPYGNNNPYADGEAILTFVKAAKYMGRDDLRDMAMESARNGYWNNIVVARALNPDSATTKGFYQWSSMAFYELATSGWPGTDMWPKRVIEMADWMIETHHTLRRRRNTAYAYEGLIHAWELARIIGDEAHMRSIGRVIERGMSKLTSWQVGGPTQNRCIAAKPTEDPFAVGGVQNHAAEPLLRIDVTQHQMHAVILARRYYFKD